MRKLHDYITTHSGFSENGVDVIFFKVVATNDANKAELTSVINEHCGEFCECNLFDGKEHNYLELGSWVGDQGLALRLIGIGAELGMWDLLTPRTMLGEFLPEDLAMQMAGAGMVGMQARV